MTGDPNTTPWVGPEYFGNRDKFPEEELAQYTGQYVAWSWDGSRIVASGVEREEVWRKVQDAGMDTNRVVLEYIDDV